MHILVQHMNIELMCKSKTLSGISVHSIKVGLCMTQGIYYRRGGL